MNEKINKKTVVIDSNKKRQKFYLTDSGAHPLAIKFRKRMRGTCKLQNYHVF